LVVLAFLQADRTAFFYFAFAIKYVHLFGGCIYDECILQNQFAYQWCRTFIIYHLHRNDIGCGQFCFVFFKRITDKCVALYFQKKFTSTQPQGINFRFFSGYVVSITGMVDYK
jgi:hypothetical protein